MTKEEYLDEIVEALKENYNEELLQVANGELEEWDLYDRVVNSDSITGNGSGSYYCNASKAREAIQGCENYIEEMLEEYGYEANVIAKHLFDYEWFDVLLRCYFLSEAIEQAVESL